MSICVLTITHTVLIQRCKIKLGQHSFHSLTSKIPYSPNPPTPFIHPTITSNQRKIMNHFCRASLWPSHWRRNHAPPNSCLRSGRSATASRSTTIRLTAKMGLVQTDRCPNAYCCQARFEFYAPTLDWFSFDFCFVFILFNILYSC